MRIFSNDGDRVIVILSSGNLSITQSAVNLLEQRGHYANQPNLWNAASLFDVATLLGDCLREGLKRVFAELPDPDWNNENTAQPAFNSNLN